MHVRNYYYSSGPTGPQIKGLHIRCPSPSLCIRPGGRPSRRRSVRPSAFISEHSSVHTLMGKMGGCREQRTDGREWIGRTDKKDTERRADGREGIEGEGGRSEHTASALGGGGWADGENTEGRADDQKIQSPPFDGGGWAGARRGSHEINPRLT